MLTTALRRTVVLAAAVCAVAVGLVPPPRAQQTWVRLSSVTGDLPSPEGSTQQTGALIGRFDKGAANGIVLAHRAGAPALVWMRRVDDAWRRQVIEPDGLPLEAGGAAYDIDADGDLDIVFGEDAQGRHLWWWENPHPRHDPAVRWTRRAIKDDGANQHHDQLFADLAGTGRPQLFFWNQRARTLFAADIPADPRTARAWPRTVVYEGTAGEGVASAAAYAEGLDAFDVDGDGRLDLLAGNHWFRRSVDGTYTPITVGAIGGRIRAGRFMPGGVAQIVIAPGDGSGPLRFYEAVGDPTQAAAWRGRDLLDRDMVHGHTLEVADIDRDGHLDIFAAEMAKWRNGDGVDHPDATAWILYGDGRGGFRRTVLTTGDDWHEGKLGDADGDGDLDVFNKPYTWMAPRLDLWLNGATRR